MSRLGKYIRENSNVKDTVCGALWAHARVTVEGTVTPCCRYNHHDHSEQPQLKDGIGAAINSDFFEDVRKRMLAGEKINECRQCYEEEKLLGDSMRTGFNKKYSKFVDTEPKIRYLETSFSSHCNLACRMCNETASSKWKLINNPGMKVDVTVDANETSFYNDTDLSELKSIKIVGGEPFINKFHAEYLDNFISRSNNPKDIVLYYNTNGTVFPNNKVLEYWKNVKEVHITFSIDAIGNLNDYLRPGSSWDTLTATIEKFKSTPDIDFVFTTHSVISNISVWKLAPLVKWKIVNFGHPGGFFILDRPRHLSIKNLPQDKKDELLEYINKVDTGEHVYTSVRNELSKQYDVETTANEIAEKEQRLDNYFGQNFRDVWKNDSFK